MFSRIISPSNFKHFRIYLLASAAGLLTFGMNSCADQHDEGELITTVKLSLSVAGSTPTVYTWQDVDGPGGNAPILPDTIKLGQVTPGGSPYLGTLEFLNEQNGKTENITLEVQAEAQDHFVCWDVSSMTMPPTGLVIARTDKDKNNLPIGLNTEWKTGGADFGIVKVRLKHQPGIKDGSSCELGETDVEVTFPYKVL